MRITNINTSFVDMTKTQFETAQKHQKLRKNYFVKFSLKLIDLRVFLVSEIIILEIVVLISYNSFISAKYWRNSQQAKIRESALINIGEISEIIMMSSTYGKEVKSTFEN